MRPKITATTISVPTLDQPLPAGSVIPGTAAVATPRAAAETTTWRRNLMVQILLELGGGGAEPGRGRADGIAPEDAPVRVRGGAAPGAEVVAQRGRVAEPGPVRDRVHRLVALLEQLLGQQDALAGQPA